MLHKHKCPSCHQFWRCGNPDCEPEGERYPLNVIPELESLRQGEDILCPPHQVAVRRINVHGLH